MQKILFNHGNCDVDSNVNLDPAEEKFLRQINNFQIRDNKTNETFASFDLRVGEKEVNDSQEYNGP